MKRITTILSLLLFSLCLQLNAQQFGNEWINYNQDYYQIKVAEDGIYRLDYTTLQNAGIPLSTINPMNFQVFTRGEEQPLYVHGESDGSFDTGDYIEFYGEANDGWLDKQLYLQPSGQLHEDYSLFADTAVYFLTWNTSTANKRFSLVNDTNYSAYQQQDHYKKVVREEYISFYLEGEPSSYGVTDPEYTEGEGWFDSPFNRGGSRTKNISTPGIYTPGQAQVRFAVAGASDYVDASGTNISPDHHLNVQFAGHTVDTLYSGYTVIRFSYSIPAQDLSSNNPFVFKSINDLGVGADRNAISYIEISYPKMPALNNQSEEVFYSDDTPEGYRYYNFSGFSASQAADIFVYDITNGKRIAATQNANSVKVLIPNAGGEKKCLLTSSDQVMMVNTLHPVSNNSTPTRFTNYAGLAKDYLIISHNRLISSPTQVVQEYAAYRNSTGLSTEIVDVDELYHQFAYGIHNHPLGIRNFVRYVWNTASVKPQYLFMLGKGYMALFRETRRGPLYDENMVPSMGNAPSDILFSSGIVDTLYQPALATGRLAAKDAGEVELYLNKVKDYDAARMQPELWQKRVLHFAGGGTIAEQNMIKSFLKSYAAIATDTLLGANIHTFYKTTSDPIQINKVDEIRKYINEGALMLTFFGHAAGVGFDISIDSPESYSNQGKYPFLLANSCFAGNLFLTSLTSAEQWILVQDRGVIGYLASISPAIPSSLNIYSTWFYKNLSSNNYGEPVGKLIKQTIEDIQMNTFSRKEICLAMTLHGDPAVSLYHYDQPDYEIKPSGISFNPPVISTDRDTFELNILISNKGRAVKDSFFVEVKRTLPGGGSTSTVLRKIKSPLYQDTLNVKLPVSGSEGVGLNRIEVFVDSYNEIPESSETNNIATVEFDIKSANIIPVYPQNFAVVPGPQVTLKASTSDPFISTKDFIFQLDTTNKFNSPLLITTKITSAGGVVEWTPPTTYQDSTVYYWRVSADSVYSGNYDWRVNSFRYINGQTGWAQSHFPQFENNNYRFVNPDMKMRKFRFVNVTNEITVQTGVYPNILWSDISFRINNDIRRKWTCLNQYPDFIGIHIIVFDTVSGEPVLSRINQVQSNGLGEYNNVHCDNSDLPTIEYFTTSTMGWNNLYQASQSWWFSQIENFLDSLPNGTPVIIYSIQNHNAENYTDQMYQAFESIGSAFIRTIDNDQPYAVFGRKGDPIGSANEVVGLGPQEKIVLKDSITSRWKEGFVKSPVIGPAQKWHSLHWDFAYSDVTPVDYVSLDVIGYRTDGTIDTVISQLPPDSLNIPKLDNIIPAGDYPKIQLVMNTRDDDFNTPAQLKEWQVLYAGIPETAINQKKHFTFYNDTLMQGDTIRMAIATENISTYDMDSLMVRYRLTDHQRNSTILREAKLKPHPAGDVLIDSIKFDTRDLQEHNNLWVEFNPDNEQHELTHINNIAEIPFYVQTDRTNPLLDVTFDGMHIMDGDIVSSRPHIIISLNDENRYLALDDTSNFNIFIQRPSDQSYRKLHFMKQGIEQLVFHPASLPDNNCKIEYDAEFEEDGMYKLKIQAKDESGNNSGDIDYTVNFEVINKSTITNVLNWPNPFSRHTHFVFTLTGSRLPDYMKIQIMTVTGKVVREIEIDELGPLRIGKNITDYTWDGTDEYGDRLGNGVYLYRVITDMNGQEIEHRETEADNFFKEGFGKMYLIR